ncbi:MAG: hypothetical protein EXR99_00670 [Gemmataceae bacterium]|nr:hypothetical protein [Gemmataceae bacterium]
MKKRQDKKTKETLLGFLGLGLDNQDEHQRVTRNEHFLLMGGSEDTHEKMQDTAIRFTESLKKKGKAIQETSKEEALDLLREATRHTLP